MTKKKKTQTPRRNTREPEHQFHRSEIVLGILVIILAAALVYVIAFHPFVGRSKDEPLDASPDYLEVEKELHEEAQTGGDDIDDDDPDDDLPRKTDLPPEPIPLSEEEVAALEAEAEKWDPEAEFRLAKDYYYSGPNKNPMRAFELFRQAAEQGHAEAQYWTGRCYDLAEGVGTDRV